MSELLYTPIDEIETIRKELKAGFASGKLKPIAYRKYQLLQLMYAVKDNMARWEEALTKDLGRPQLESRFVELVPIIGEAHDLYKNVEKWAKDEKPPFDITWTPMRPVIKKEPKGTVLVVSPFNYPVWLTLGPVAGAIAAGCAVAIKPSEMTPHTSNLMAELLHKYLDNDLVRVVNGAIPETTKLLELQWDHILYTGSGRVGQIVATAAAKHLTPVTLELGGKSPVIIDPGCDLKTAARRILWGKVLNAGQTCVAPDYVLVPRDFQETFVAALKEVYDQFYPDGDPAAPGAYSRIVTPQSTSRIASLLEGTKGTTVIGGNMDKESKFIAPTVVKDVQANDSLMSQEIFGPVLPIVPVDSIEDAIKFVNANPHPLVVYVFSRDDKVKTKVLKSTTSGAFFANEVIIHPGAEGMPFGGVGDSGYGYHTGKFSFDTFTYLRTTLDSPSWIDRIVSFRFPPYNSKKSAMVLKMMQSIPARPKGPPTGETTNFWRGKRFILTFALAVAALLVARRRSIV